MSSNPLIGWDLYLDKIGGLITLKSLDLSFNNIASPLTALQA
ncbi:MAG: hypothetical protein ACLFQU_11405 [Candidatus Kapaibacterium sp.]